VCCCIAQVNASVDVYAFGVMMWELFVGQRPYGNMSQQKVGDQWGGGEGGAAVVMSNENGAVQQQ
jgi:hypothetical protein